MARVPLSLRECRLALSVFAIVVGAPSVTSFQKNSSSQSSFSSLLNDCGCGQFSCGLPNREERVLGGEITGKVEYPWLAYLTYRGKLYCGASLINDRYLVTAGHCIDRVQQSKVVVHLGKHHRTSSVDTEQELKVQDWWLHSGFNRRTFAHDIGLIKLKAPVILGKYVRPICLPVEGGSSLVGAFGTVVGWGRTSEKGISSDYPRQIKIPVISQDDCRKKKYEPAEITNNMFCAGFDQGKIDACQGDSGGPFMLETKEVNGQIRYELAGIVSWGQGCGRSGYPGVYTRVENYLSFIKEHLKPNCFC